MFLHPSGFEAEQGVEQIVGETAEESSGQADNSIRTGRERAERISLGGIARQLVDFIADCTVELPSRKRSQTQAFKLSNSFSKAKKRIVRTFVYGTRGTPSSTK